MENSTTQIEETLTVGSTFMRWDFNTGWSVCAGWGVSTKAYPPVGSGIISLKLQ